MPPSKKRQHINELITNSRTQGYRASYDELDDALRAAGFEVQEDGDIIVYFHRKCRDGFQLYRGRDVKPEVVKACVRLIEKVRKYWPE